MKSRQRDRSHISCWPWAGAYEANVVVSWRSKLDIKSQRTFDEYHFISLCHDIQNDIHHDWSIPEGTGDTLMKRLAKIPHPLPRFCLHDPTLSLCFVFHMLLSLVYVIIFGPSSSKLQEAHSSKELLISFSYTAYLRLLLIVSDDINNMPSMPTLTPATQILVTVRDAILLCSESPYQNQVCGSILVKLALISGIWLSLGSKIGHLLYVLGSGEALDYSWVSSMKSITVSKRSLRPSTLWPWAARHRLSTSWTSWSFGYVLHVHWRPLLCRVWNER